MNTDSHGWDEWGALRGISVQDLKLNEHDGAPARRS
jgi:hypothetical protein